MPTLTAADVKRLLHLAPHPREGGWFVRTHDSGERIAAAAFHDGRYPSPRATGTAIYYLLEPDTFSEMHVLASDEIFHHYLGDAVEMLQLHPGGATSRHVLGPDLVARQTPQLTVKRGIWQGSHMLTNEHGFALLGCTVSPGFEFEDYRSAPRTELIAQWPAEAELITKLTNS
jgi:predicted cupin superfamily sugar epimerase